MRFFLIFTLSFFLINAVKAHEGGHYHKSSGSYLNSWELNDGTIVKGNFSMEKNGIVCLEQYDGQYIKIPITKLTAPYQKIIKIKINQFHNLNREFLAYNNSESKPLDKNVWWFLSYILIVLFLINIIYTPSHNKYLIGKIWLKKFPVAALLFVLIIIACNKASNESVSSLIIPKTRTTFLDSAFSVFRPSISTSFDNNYYYVSAGGMPQHNMMIGITSWQQQVPIPQAYTGTNSWSIPLQPVYASIPLSTRTNLMKGAVAIAINGIPIFNALNNRGVDSYATGELDNWGGHCGRADDYHYHAAPLHLAGTSGILPIAFALDGFAVYGQKEPDGSTMLALDTCHGHVIGNGVYHYHGTTTYPYVVGAMRGKVSLDPSTSAPENQILPQAFASPVRPALTPLSGAIITDFQSTGINAYKLTYQRGNKFGYVEYSWDSNNRYTYKLTDTSGAVSINVYQR
jgi:hypothetical protein